MAASHKLSKIQSQLRQMQRSWPVDPLRLNQPDLQFSAAISKAIDRVFSNTYKSNLNPSIPPQELDERTLKGAERMLTSLENLSNGNVSKQVRVIMFFCRPHFFLHWLLRVVFKSFGRSILVPLPPINAESFLISKTLRRTNRGSSTSDQRRIISLVSEMDPIYLKTQPNHPQLSRPQSTSSV